MIIRNGGVSALTFGDNCSGSSDFSVFDRTCQWLDHYFAGLIPDQLPPLSLEGTPFQKKVWEALLTVPYGHTATYGDIARSIGCRSSQAVGQAIHRNPVAIIIPCHRIIGADGSLTGYAAGLSTKTALLRIEGVLLV